MPLVAAICCLLLAWRSGEVWEATHTDAAFIVCNLYLIAGLILAGMVKVNVKPRKSKNEPTGSGKVSPEAKGESPEDK